MNFPLIKVVIHQLIDFVIFHSALIHIQYTCTWHFIIFNKPQYCYMVTIFSLFFVHVYTPLLVLNTLGSLKIMCSYVTETILNSGFHEFRAGSCRKPSRLLLLLEYVEALSCLHIDLIVTDFSGLLFNDFPFNLQWCWFAQIHCCLIWLTHNTYYMHIYL